MSGFSTYLAQKLIDHVLRGASYTAPANAYLSLHTADPTDDNVTSTEINSATATWYGRKQVTGWSAAVGTGTSTTNSNQLSFSAVTGSAVTVTHWGLYDASTSGNLLCSGALTTSKVLNVDDVFVVNAGDLSLDFQ